MYSALLVLCTNVLKMYSALLFFVQTCGKCTVHCWFVYTRVENVQCTADLCIKLGNCTVQCRFVYNRVENVQCTAGLCINLWKM